MRAGRGTLLALALGVGVVLTGCVGPRVLLDESDFPGVVEIHQGGSNNPPGWTWCDLSAGLADRVNSHASSLVFDDGTWVAAKIVDNTKDQMPAADVLRRTDESAAWCASHSASIDRGYSIEPLEGLAEGELGWRTREPDGEWGEHVLVPLDEWRFLAVGFVTEQEKPPVDLDRLVSLAKEGAARFPADGG